MCSSEVYYASVFYPIDISLSGIVCPFAPLWLGAFSCIGLGSPTKIAT